MEADLYVQGHYCATIDLPGDGIIALLAKGMITHAEHHAKLLQQELNAIDGVTCQISLRYKQPVSYKTLPEHQDPHEEISWPDTKRPNRSSTRPSMP